MLVAGVGRYLRNNAGKEVRAVAAGGRTELQPCLPPGGGDHWGRPAAVTVRSSRRNYRTYS